MSKRIILIVLLLVGLAAAGYIAVQRAHVESRNRAVDIVVDYSEIEQMAAASGQSPIDVLRKFKAKGVTGVAISEETFRDAVNQGIVWQTGDHIFELDKVADQGLIEHMQQALPYAHDYISFTPTSNAGGAPYEFTIRRDIPISYLNQLPIGLPKKTLAAIHFAGLEPVARLINYPGATPKAIEGILAEVKAEGIKRVIFSGDQVLGFKGAVEDTAKSLVDNGLYFGRVEFSKQKGELNLAEKAPANTIIVHSITQAEMPQLDEASIVERFQKAVRERGVRICYVRMYHTASDNLVDANADYIGSITKSITKAGYVITGSHPLGEVAAPRILRVLAGVGVAAGAILLLTSIFELPMQSLLIWAILAFAGCAGLAGMGDTGRKLVALLAAIIFPTLAAVHAVKGTPETPTAAPNALWGAVGRLLHAIAISAAGGMLIVGLISQRTFMLRINQFMGVKLAHMAPVLILAALIAGGIIWKSDTWAAQKKRFTDSIRRIGQNPILIWQAIGMIAMLVIVAMMVARSGNDSGMEVSSFELKFRALLDKILYVRPRTKEFLIGYPALIVGIAYALRGRRQWAAPLIALGSIGLISALNTFCHIHTPITVSLWRIVNGTVVGIIFGLIAYKLVERLPGREIETAEAPVSAEMEPAVEQAE